MLVGAFGMILIACLNYPGGADARELLAHCSKLYPNLHGLANMDEAWEQHLKSDFTAILDKIPGFSYGAKRFFLLVSVWYVRRLWFVSIERGVQPLSERRRSTQS